MLRSVSNEIALIVLLVGIVLSGCARNVRDSGGVPPRRVDPDSELSRGAGTGIETQDIRTVTSRMARSMLQIPEFENPVKPPVVAILPVENNTRFPIDTGLFTTRIMGELQRNAMGRVRFVARNRIEDVLAERARRDRGEVSPTTRPQEVAGADYYLTGELRGRTQRGATGHSDYVLYYFQLIDTESSIIVWGDIYEIEREGLEDVIYR